MNESDILTKPVHSLFIMHSFLGIRQAAVELVGARGGVGLPSGDGGASDGALAGGGFRCRGRGRAGGGGALQI